MNILCTLGNIFKIVGIKEFPKKTMLTIVANRVRIIITRYLKTEGMGLLSMLSPTSSLLTVIATFSLFLPDIIFPLF